MATSSAELCGMLLCMLGQTVASMQPAVMLLLWHTTLLVVRRHLNKDPVYSKMRRFLLGMNVEAGKQRRKDWRPCHNCMIICHGLHAVANTQAYRVTPSLTMNFSSS